MMKTMMMTTFKRHQNRLSFWCDIPSKRSRSQRCRELNNL